MSTQKPRLHFRYLVLAIVVAIFLVVVSLILYPAWTVSLRAMLGLLALVIVAVLSTVKKIRDMLESLPTKARRKSRQE